MHDDTSHHTPDDETPNSNPGSLFPERPSIGLALGAGVARGWSHIGVIRALERYGIKPDFIAGTSIGAVVGGLHAAGHLDKLTDWALAMNRTRMLSYFDLRMAGGGLIGGDRLVAEMKTYLQDSLIEELPVGFSAIAADLMTGNEIWLRTGEVTTAIRASMSLPGIFHPVWLHNRWLIDGAVVNPVPVSTCRAQGAQIVIAVNLTADLIGQIRSNSGPVPRVAGFDMLPTVEAASKTAGLGRLKRALWNPFARALFGRESNDTPSLFGAMVSTLNVVQDRITRSRLAGDPPDVLIEPRVGHIGLMEFDRAEELIQLGEAAVEAALTHIDDMFAIHGVPGGIGLRL